MRYFSWVLVEGLTLSYPEGPCTQIVYTLALKYLYRDYIKAKVYTNLGTWTLRVSKMGISGKNMRPS